MKHNQEYQSSLYQKKVLSGKLLAYFKDHNQSLLKDRKRALKLINCFNKSKQCLRQIGEQLTVYFTHQIETLGSWALLDGKCESFVQFMDGTTLLIDFFMDLMSSLLQYWAEEQFFKICLERILFKIILVWNAFFQKINEVRHFNNCILIDIY